MKGRTRHPIRRPSIVVLTLGAAAVVAVPAGAGQPVEVTRPAPVEVTRPASTEVAPLDEARGTRDRHPAHTSVTAADLVRAGAVGAPSAPPAVVPPAPVEPVLPAVSPPTPVPPRITTAATPGTSAAAAIAFALAQRGLPYVWGGDGPEVGDGGFDCSGLTTAAYDYAGVNLPRTAHTQYYTGPHVPDHVALQPGDLVFYGTLERVHHVGLYLGDGRMVNAPTFGKPVRLAYVRYAGDDYLGATRPAAGRNAPGLLKAPERVDVPAMPRPAAPRARTEFPAPPAPDEDVRAATATSRSDDPAEAQGRVDRRDRPAQGSTEGSSATAGTAPPSSSSAPPTTAREMAPTTGLTATPSATESTTTESTTTESTTTTPPTTSASNTRTSAARKSDTTAPAATAPDSTTPQTTTPQTTTPKPTTPKPTTPKPTTPEPSSKGAATTGAAETGTPNAEPAAPTGITLPGGERLRLAAAKPDENGLPAPPSTPGRAAVSWRPEEDGAWTAAVGLHPDVDADGLDGGATVVVIGEDGTRTELTVRSRRTVDPGTAAKAARGTGDGPRLVLLRTDADTGEVLAIVAE